MEGRGQRAVSGKRQSPLPGGMVFADSRICQQFQTDHRAINLGIYLFHFLVINFPYVVCLTDVVYVTQPCIKCTCYWRKG